jgi:hypothetical protein
MRRQGLIRTFDDAKSGTYPSRRRRTPAFSAAVNDIEGTHTNRIARPPLQRFVMRVSGVEFSIRAFPSSETEHRRNAPGHSH